MATPPRRSDTTSGSPRPSSPSPARSMRTRMTSVMRRASTGLAFGTKMPTLSRSSSKNSLKVDPAQAPSTSETHAAPSPVAETAEDSSPVAPAPLGPSPLANATAAPEQLTATTAPPPEAASGPVPAPEPVPVVVVAPADEETPAKQLTRSPEQLTTELPPHAPAPAPEPQPFGFSDPIVPATQTQKPEPAESPVIVPTDASVPAEPTAAPLPEPTPAIPLPPPVDAATRPTVEDSHADYFSFNDPVAPTVVGVKVEEPQPIVPEVPSTPARRTIPVEEPAHYEEISHVQIPTDDSTFAWSDTPALGHKQSRSSLSEPAPHTQETSQQSGNQSGKVSTRGSKSSLASSYGNVMASPSDHRRGRSSSVRFIDPEDPFADPPEATKKGLSPITSVNMPEPVTESYPETQREVQVDDSPTPISFPLPPLQDVINAQYVFSMSHLRVHSQLCAQDGPSVGCSLSVQPW
ncbi:hypothetical protein BD413DRAFT_303298 [Trametes elegans]|nr:hypothetical protein BD413DRAFT_303298 [Trametes elegans]